MPKWFHHRSVAKNLCIHLPRKIMEGIDSTLDGIRSGYEHDFWRYDTASLKKCMLETYSLYGSHGLKYCLLHIFLDILQAFIVSERTREALGAKMMRAYAHEIAFAHAVGVMERHVKDCLQEHTVILEQFLSEIKSKEREITRIVTELPEVRAQVEGVEKFKRKRGRAEEIARRCGAEGFLIPIYTSFILELWNDRKREGLTKEAWVNEVLEKYKETLKRSYKDSSEKIYTDFVNIAKRLGYLN